MIETLIVQKAGKFANQVFNLGPATIFLGPNEAGKTTLFDAFFFSICRPRRSHSMLQRYDAIDAKIVSARPVDLPIAVDVFLNLLAIRSGALTVQFDDKANWQKTIKENLLASGIDPLALLNLCKPKAKTISELAKLAGEKTILNGRLGELQAARQRLSFTQQTLHANADHISAIQAQIAEVVARIQKLNDATILAGKIRQRDELYAVLRSLDNIEGLQKNLQSLKPFANFEQVVLNSLQENLKAAQAALTLALAEARAAQQDLSIDLPRRRELEKELQMEVGFQNQCHTFAALLKDLANHPPKRKKLICHTAALFMLLTVLAAAAATQMFVGGLSKQLIFSGLFGLTLILIKRGFSYSLVIDTAAAQGQLKALKERWTAEVRPIRNGALGDKDLQATLQALLSLQYQSTGAEQRLQNECSSIARRQQIYEDAQSRVNQANELLLRRQTELNTYLKAFAADSTEEFFDKLHRYQQCLSNLKLEEQAVAKFAQNLAGDRLHWNAHYLALDKAVNGAEQWTSEALKQAEQELIDLQTRHFNLKKDEEAWLKSHHEQTGQMLGEGKNLPAQILNFEQQLQALESASAALMIEHQATNIARSIFAEMAAAYDTQFKELEADVLALLDSTDDTGDIQIKGLKESEISVKDRRGAHRSLKNLSAGSRDFYFLAARLALAKRFNPSLKTLFFDEPFLTFDELRVEKAIAFIKQFASDGGWQLIFFTKEQTLCKSLQRQFEDVVLHELEAPLPLPPTSSPSIGY